MIYDSNDLIKVLPLSGDLRAVPSFPPSSPSGNATFRMLVVELSICQSLYFIFT